MSKLHQFRVALLGLSFFLGCQAIWMLTVEYFRSPSLVQAKDHQDFTVVLDNRSTAALAALSAFIPSDLWSGYALTYFKLVDSNEFNAHPERFSKIVEQADEVVDRALSRAPHDARIWLLAAEIDSRLGSRDHKAAAAMRMSYYTGPNETELVPLRLKLAVSSDQLVDNFFRQLVRHDIQIIATRRPDLKSALRVAFQQASPSGQEFVEETVKEMDPALLVILDTKK
jgi:hypothetical protein